jgi:hypothetical protein
MPPADDKQPQEAPSSATRWLSQDEEAAWRALASVIVTLPWALECQLQRDAGLSVLEYYVLARLSKEPEASRPVYQPPPESPSPDEESKTPAA